MKKIWKFLNSPLFDYVGGFLLCIGTIIYFIGYKQIEADVNTFIFASLLVIGFDCMSRGGERLFIRKSSAPADDNKTADTDSAT